MASSPRDVEREEERRLNMRTLTIASSASAAAAAVTSQLWIAGTWIAAALTPVLVTLISEAMHRPTERIARAWTAAGAGEARSSRAISPTHREPTAVTGTPGPVRVYRAGGGSGSRSTMLTRRRIALGTVAATAAIACVIGLLTLTTVDLVSGGSVGKGSGRFTLAGGKSKTDQQEQKGPSTQQKQQQDSTGQQDGTQRDQTTTPSQPAPQAEPPSDTAPAPPPSQTAPGEPVPQPQSP